MQQAVPILLAGNGLILILLNLTTSNLHNSDIQMYRVVINFMGCFILYFTASNMVQGEKYDLSAVNSSNSYFLLGYRLVSRVLYHSTAQIRKIVSVKILIYIS